MSAKSKGVNSVSYWNSCICVLAKDQMLCCCIWMLFCFY